MHKAHHVYKKDMSRPCAKKQKGGEKDEKVKKKMPRLSLQHHEVKSTPPCKQQADPAQTARVLFFCVVTALNEKNAGQPNFPPPFVSPLP